MQYTLDKGLDLALVTNGTLIRDGLEDILVKGKWVRVSIDAGKKETYSKVRSVPEAYFQRTLDNLQKLAEAKRADPNSELIIGIGFVVTKENWMEIYEAVQIFSQLGVDNVRISAMFSQEDFDYHKGHYTLAKEATKRAKADFERSDYKVFDLFGDRIEDLKQHRPDYEFCPYMHLNTYIGGDLNVYTCCNNAYSLVGEMGSIKDQSFREFWESQAKEKAYGGFKAPTCERCMFNAKNRFMNYLLEEDPAHVNYI
jgi:MoaA/NifB/PqqE/SkfB family radical SAM enzyme